MKIRVTVMIRDDHASVSAITTLSVNVNGWSEAIELLVLPAVVTVVHTMENWFSVEAEWCGGTAGPLMSALCHLCLSFSLSLHRLFSLVFSPLHLLFLLNFFSVQYLFLALHLSALYLHFSVSPLLLSHLLSSPRLSPLLLKSILLYWHRAVMYVVFIKLNL